MFNCKFSFQLIILIKYIGLFYFISCVISAIKSTSSNCIFSYCKTMEFNLRLFLYNFIVYLLLDIKHFARKGEFELLAENWYIPFISCSTYMNGYSTNLISLKLKKAIFFFEGRTRFVSANNDCQLIKEWLNYHKLYRWTLVNITIWKRWKIYFSIESDCRYCLLLWENLSSNDLYEGVSWKWMNDSED